MGLVLPLLKRSAQPACPGLLTFSLRSISCSSIGFRRQQPPRPAACPAAGPPWLSRSSWCRAARSVSSTTRSACFRSRTFSTACDLISDRADAPALCVGACGAGERREPLPATSRWSAAGVLCFATNSPLSCQRPVPQLNDLRAPPLYKQDQPSVSNSCPWQSKSKGTAGGCQHQEAGCAAELGKLVNSLHGQRQPVRATAEMS